MQFPLAGERLDLRPFAPGDVAAAHTILGDPLVMRWVGHGALRTPSATEAVLREYMAHQERHGFSFWAVIERSSGRLIGDAGLFHVSGEVQLGYTLGAEWWGLGYGTEAAGLCLAPAFGELGLTELAAVVEPENERSVHVLEKLGFARDGRCLAYGREHLVYRMRGPLTSEQ